LTLVSYTAQQLEAIFGVRCGEPVMRYMLTDELWAYLQPQVEAAKRHKGGQPPILPDRAFFEALLYLARTSIPWRDLPAEFGAWDAVYNRFRRWVSSGALERLFQAMTAEPRFGEVRRVLIDATIVRGHQHAAGARRKKKKSAGSGRARPRRWAAAAAG
jgi:transposase